MILMEDRDTLKNEVELFLKNGTFEVTLIPCLLRNEKIKTALENEVKDRLEKLKYMPQIKELRINSLKQHEILKTSAISLALEHRTIKTKNTTGFYYRNFF